MRKDTILGIIITAAGIAFLALSPLLGILAYVFMGTILSMGFWMLLNSRRKRKADRLSDDKGRNCYGKVLRIEPYVTETGLAQTVESVKRVLVCIYDEASDRFVNVADIMDEKDIRFAIGEFITVAYFINDFNYISTVSGLDSIPKSIRDKFLKLIERVDPTKATMGAKDDTVEEINPYTANWTITEEAYSDGMHLTAGQEKILATNDESLINALVNCVETVSAIKDFDIEGSRSFAVKMLLIMMGLFFLLSAIFGIFMMYIYWIR